MIVARPFAYERRSFIKDGNVRMSRWNEAIGRRVFFCADVGDGA